MPSFVRRRWQDHAVLLIVLGLAVLARLAMWLAFRPAITYPDSWTYLDEALGTFPVGLGEIRPSGYPLLLRVLQTPFRNLGIVTFAQHAAGIATGLVLWSLLRRLAVPAWITLVATAIVLLDGYLILVEQFVLAEAFFIVVFAVSLWLLVVHGEDDRAIAASGALLAASPC